MYLSRVRIDIQNRKKMKDLTHLGAYHGWVEESFPDEMEIGERSRKLWRIDQVDNKLYLLLLSENKPEKEKLEKYGIKDSFETKNYNLLLDQLQVGDRFEFRVVLNPVISIGGRKEENKRGRVIPLITVEQQLAYLKQRATKHGFSLDDNEIMITEKSFERLERPGQGRNVLRICKAAYRGFLTITDRDLFKATLINGIGKKKAYGFGLLTIIPISQSSLQEIRQENVVAGA